MVLAVWGPLAASLNKHGHAWPTVLALAAQGPVAASINEHDPTWPVFVVTSRHIPVKHVLTYVRMCLTMMCLAVAG